MGGAQETPGPDRYARLDQFISVELSLVPKGVLFGSDDHRGRLALQHLHLRYGRGAERVAALAGGDIAGVEHDGDLGRDGHGMLELVEGAGLQIQRRIVQDLEAEAEGGVFQHAAKTGHRCQVAAGAVAADGHPVLVDVEFLRVGIEPAHHVEGVVRPCGPGVVRRFAVVDADHIDIQLFPGHVAPYVHILAVAAHKAAAVHIEVYRSGLALRAVEDAAHLSIPGGNHHPLPSDGQGEGIGHLCAAAGKHGLSHHEKEIDQFLPAHFPHVFLVHEIGKSNRFHMISSCLLFCLLLYGKEGLNATLFSGPGCGMSRNMV